MNKQDCKSGDISDCFFRDHKLAPYSTFQIGGEADYFFEAKSAKDLQEAVAWARHKKFPFVVIGGGSNLLFDDEGFRGLVIKFVASEILVPEDTPESGVHGTLLVADAGAKMAAVVKAAADAGLTGIEAWHGMPGTVGGAVVGNAGCFGVEVADVLEWAQVLMPKDGIVTVEPSFFEYEYRGSRLKNGGASMKAGTVASMSAGMVVRAGFRLRKGDPAEIKKAMMEIAKKRLGKQPAGASTGSFFKNPPDYAAGWLIEQCGLKGKQIGGAKISEQHANFFVNAGGARSVDVLALADLAATEVKRKFGIELEREVIFIAAS